MSGPLAQRRTVFEQRYGKPPGAEELVKLWNDALTDNLLALVWQAYDRMYTDLLRHIPWNEDYDDLERSISEELERVIQEIMDGFLPVRVQHSPFERESRAKPPAQPPVYDIAFIWNSDPRIMWPLEAKVLKNDKNTLDNLGDYVRTVKSRYLTCKYAPFSNGAAMISYLKSGNATTLMVNIEASLDCILVAHPSFAHRHHKCSEHLRKPPEGKGYPKDFRCHHLVFLLGTSSH